MFADAPQLLMLRATCACCCWYFVVKFEAQDGDGHAPQKLGHVKGGLSTITASIRFIQQVKQFIGQFLELTELVLVAFTLQRLAYFLQQLHLYFEEIKIKEPNCRKTIKLVDLVYLFRFKSVQKIGVLPPVLSVQLPEIEGGKAMVTNGVSQCSYTSFIMVNANESADETLYQLEEEKAGLKD